MFLFVRFSYMSLSGIRDILGTQRKEIEIEYELLARVGAKNLDKRRNEKKKQSIIFLRDGELKTSLKRQLMSGNYLTRFYYGEPCNLPSPMLLQISRRRPQP